MTKAIPMALAGQMIDLQAEAELLSLLADIAPHWKTVAHEISVDTAPRLFEWLATALLNGDAGEIFSRLGLSSLHERLKAARDSLATLPPEVQKLLAPVGSFVETPLGGAGLQEGWIDGGNPGLVSWSPSVGIAPPLATDIKLKLDLAAALEVEAGALWPFSGDKVDPGLLRISATGRAKAGIDAPLPYQFFDAKGAVATDIACSLHFFFRPEKPDSIFAAVLAQALRRMPDPFDPDAVWQACATGGLEGIILTFDGGASVGLEVAAGREVDVPQIVSGQLAATVSVGLWRRAQYQLSVRGVGNALHVPPRLAISLSRDRRSGRNWAAGLDLSLDPTGLAARVQSLVAQGLETWDAALAEVRPFLTPGDWLRNAGAQAMDKAIDKLVSDVAVRDSLQQTFEMALGTRLDDQAFAQALRKRLLDAVDRTAQAGSAAVEARLRREPALVREKGGQAALLISRALAASGAPNMSAALENAVSGALTAYADALSDAVEAMVTRSGIDRVEASLKRLGVKVEGGVADANDALAGVRDLIGHFESTLRKIMSQVQQVVGAKIQAQLSYEEKRLHEVQYEVKGWFDAITGPAGDIYRGLAFGRLTSLEQVFAGPVAGFTLAQDSSVRRFSENTKALGYCLVLLGIEDAGGSLLSGKAEIWRSADGTDIRVAGEGGFKRWRKSRGESRSLTFTSAHSLLLAKAELDRRTSQLSLVATHGDTDLKLAEVDGFLDRLVEARLLASRRKDAARELFDDWAQTRGTSGMVAGTISVTMQLGAQDILALIARGRAIEAGDGEAAKHMFRLGVMAMRRTHAWDEEAFGFDTRQGRFFPGLGDVGKIGPPIDFLFAARRTLLSPMQASPIYNLLRERVSAADGLIIMASNSARIFDSVPAPAGSWTQKEYAKAQEHIAGASAKWLRLNGIPLFAFREKMHRRTVAFFLALAWLARGFDPGSDPLRAETVFPECDDLMGLTMQREGEERIMIL